MLKFLGKMCLQVCGEWQYLETIEQLSAGTYITYMDEKYPQMIFND